MRTCADTCVHVFEHFVIWLVHSLRTRPKVNVNPIVIEITKSRERKKWFFSGRNFSINGEPSQEIFSGNAWREGRSLHPSKKKIDRSTFFSIKTFPEKYRTFRWNFFTFRETSREKISWKLSRGIRSLRHEKNSPPDAWCENRTTFWRDSTSLNMTQYHVFWLNLEFMYWCTGGGYRLTWRNRNAISMKY